MKTQITLRNDQTCTHGFHECRECASGSDPKIARVVDAAKAVMADLLNSDLNAQLEAALVSWAEAVLEDESHLLYGMGRKDFEKAIKGDLPDTQGHQGAPAKAFDDLRLHQELFNAALADLAERNGIAPQEGLANNGLPEGWRVGWPEHPSCEAYFHDSGGFVRKMCDSNYAWDNGCDISEKFRHGTAPTLEDAMRAAVDETSKVQAGA